MNWRLWLTVAVIAFLLVKAPATMGAFVGAVFKGLGTFWSSLNWH